jgi:hypothetical protein
MISIVALVLVVSIGFLVRSILPIADLRTKMVMAGHSKAEIGPL